LDKWNLEHAQCFLTIWFMIFFRTWLFVCNFKNIKNQENHISFTQLNFICFTQLNFWTSWWYFSMNKEKPQLMNMKKDDNIRKRKINYHFTIFNIFCPYYNTVLSWQLPKYLLCEFNFLIIQKLTNELTWLKSYIF